MTDFAEISIPDNLLPADGRFGAGPSRVRAEQIDALSHAGLTVLGTSHRQPGVKNLVGRVRRGLTELFALPDGYEVVLGNGGSTAFWDTAMFSLIEKRAQTAVIGEFSSKFAAEIDGAPHLDAAIRHTADPGTGLRLPIDASADVTAYPHNETSTGVMLPVQRPADAPEGQLALVDATSAAGGVMVDITAADAYYFAPQKAFGSDGGLWLSVMSPAAVARIERLASSDRWIPEFLSLSAALANSRKDQTLNTPAVATLLMLAEQIDWMLEQGGLAWADNRTRASSDLLYAWAARREEITPFVADEQYRSQVVVTLDVDESIDATAITAALRRMGIVDIEPYRKLGRNQLRIAVFPSVPTSDVEALIAVLEYLLDHR